MQLRSAIRTILGRIDSGFGRHECLRKLRLTGLTRTRIRLLHPAHPTPTRGVWRLLDGALPHSNWQLRTASRTCFKNGRGLTEGDPQGLKPIFIGSVAARIKVGP